MGKLIVLVFLIMIWPFGWLTIPLAFFYCIIPAIKEIGEESRFSIRLFLWLVVFLSVAVSVPGMIEITKFLFPGK